MGKGNPDKVRADAVAEHDPVNSPAHYRSDPSGVECITITRHRNFNIGNAIKYLWRAGLKVPQGSAAQNALIEDLHKAIWYITDEIKLIQKTKYDEDV